MVAAITFLAFLPALSNGFVSWDDAKNFLDNPHYRGLGPTQLGWMWTTFHLGHYVPLSWMTLGLDYTLWGMNPAGYHLTSLLLHCVDAVLVFLLARRLLVRSGVVPADDVSIAGQLPAAFAALLFSIHPLRVESVVWITERRDVLSLLFYLACVLVYLSAVEKADRRSYWLAVALYLCALLSKATAMTLPAVLLLLNVYPLRRFHFRDGILGVAARRVYLEIAPFAVLTMASIVLSIVALHPPEQLPVLQKIAVSAFSLCFYVYRTLVPANLSPLYEMPQHVDPLAMPFVVAYVGTAILFTVVLMNWRRWPGLTASWLGFFLISLPMLGFVQNGPQIAADRYTYHAAVALAILAAAGYAYAVRRARAASRVIASMIVVVLGVLTYDQSHIWHDSEALWERVLVVDPSSPIAHSSYAALLYKRGRVDDAMAHSERAVSLAPEFAEARNNLGLGLTERGRLDDAIEQFRAALALKPGYDEAHNNWGVAVARKGDFTGAIEHYRSALASNADNANAQVNWGNALVRLDRPADAIPHYEQAVRIWIDDADAHLNWGVALARENKLAEAMEHFRKTLAIDPNSVEARDYLEKATRMLSQQR